MDGADAVLPTGRGPQRQQISKKDQLYRRLQPAERATGSMTPVQRTAPPPVEAAFSRKMDFAYGAVREIIPGVRRIVAENPSPFTFKGTNTYLVGDKEIAVIDPGPDLPAHREALLRAIGPARVTYILITHTHRDHTDGAATLREITGAPILAHGPTGRRRGALTDHPAGKAFIDDALPLDERLRDGDTVRGAGWALDVIHTPGHAPDHLCFALVGRRTVFSGDHVMGWNTTVVAPPEGHMGDYIASLTRLLKRRDTLFLPGHGGRIATPQRVVKAYLMHRRWRESAIFGCLEEGCRTIPQIVARIYAGLESSLIPAAGMSVLAHLEHLIERGLVAADLPLTLESRFWPA